MDAQLSEDVATRLHGEFDANPYKQDSTRLSRGL
jgi:hypothetical protein